MGNCKRYAALCLSALLLVGSLCGCGDQDEKEYSENAGLPPEQVTTVSGVDAADQFADRDYVTAVQGSAVAVTLLDNGFAAGDGVSVKGDTITVKNAALTYFPAACLIAAFWLMRVRRSNPLI